MKRIAMVNQKGGVGKTTTTINLATALAAFDQKVLVIDMDPQGNASTGLGVYSRDHQKGTYDLLLADHLLADIIIKTKIPNLDLVMASPDLSGAEIELVSVMAREFRLQHVLQEASLAYDYILFDCPPSLGLLTLNSLVAADSIIVPLQCEFYALEGLSQLKNTIERVQARLNSQLNLYGIVLTMYDRRNALCNQVVQDVRHYFGETVFKTVIPRNVRISEAPSHGVPVLIYDMRSPGSLAYIQLAREILVKEGKI